MHVPNLKGLFAANDGAEGAFGDAEARLFDVSGAGAVAGAQVEPFTRFIEHQERRHLGAHEIASLARDGFKRVIDVQRGSNRLSDVEERFEPARLQANLFVQPGVFDDVRGKSREVFEKFFVGSIESV